MQQELLIAIFAGLGGMMGWGFADFLAKKTIDKIGDVTTLFWAQLIGIFPLFILYLFNPAIPQMGTFDLIYLLILGVWSGLSYIPTYVAFGKGKVSLLSPIFASYAVVVTLISALIFKETIPFNRQIAFLIVFAGMILINGDPRDIFSMLKGGKKKLETIRGLPEILLAVGLYSIWLVGLDNFLGGKNWIPLLLVIRIFSTLSLFFYAIYTHHELKVKAKGLWKFLLPIGIFDVAAFSFVSFGFSATTFTSIVAMLGGAFSLPTILLARAFLKEKVTTVQTVGSIVIIAGIIVLFFRA